MGSKGENKRDNIPFKGQHTPPSVTSIENTITLSFQLTAVNHHKTVDAMQTFSDLLHFFGEMFFSFKNSRNIVKPSKERN